MKFTAQRKNFVWLFTAAHLSHLLVSASSSMQCIFSRLIPEGRTPLRKEKQHHNLIYLMQLLSPSWIPVYFKLLLFLIGICHGIFIISPIFLLSLSSVVLTQCVYTSNISCRYHSINSAENPCDLPVYPPESAPGGANKKHWRNSVPLAVKRKGTTVKVDIFW